MRGRSRRFGLVEEGVRRRSRGLRRRKNELKMMERNDEEEDEDPGSVILETSSSSSSSERPQSSQPAHDDHSKPLLHHSNPSSSSTLLRLPNQLILLIAQLLILPSLSIESWDHRPIDLIHLSSTSRSIRSIIKPLIYSQISIRIHPSSLLSAPSRLHQLISSLPPSTTDHHHPIKKLLILDHHHPSHQSSSSSHSLSHSLSHLIQLQSIQFFGYSANLDRVTHRSPYDLISIDPLLLISLAHLPNLRSLYLSGLKLSTSSSSSSLPFQRSSSLLLNRLTTLHLIAIHDSILPIIHRAPNLLELRIWRDFLIPYPSVDPWFPSQLWSSLQSLTLKGFYGHSLSELQSSLRRNIDLITSLGSSLILKTLDLDKPYSTHDLLILLDAFSSNLLTTLRLTVWRDEDFNPSLINRLAIQFPNLQDLQIILETPLHCWWPHKLVHKFSSSSPSLNP